MAILLAGCGGIPKSPLASPKDQQPRGTSKESRKPARPPTIGTVAAAHARYASAVIHELNGDAETALAEFCEAAAADPSNEWLMLEVSRRLIAHRKLERAAELLTLAAKQPDVSGPVLARLAMVQSQLGNAAESLETSRAAIRKAPATLAAYQSQFVTQVQNKRLAEALETLDAAAKVSKPAPEFLIGLSELYVTYGLQVPDAKKSANEKAVELLKRARKLNPPEPVLKLKLADGLSLLGEQQAAAELYTELLSKAGSLPMLQENVQTKLANIYLRSSNKEKAAEQLIALTQSDPTNPQPYYFLGQLAFEQQKVSEAADYFSKTILLSPDFEPAYYELANAQLADNKAREALETLDKARAKFAAGFAMEFFSAVAATRLNDFDRALRHFTAAEIIANTTDPKRLNHIFYFQLGVACEQKKDYDQAARAFEKCLELSPDFAEAMNYLGYMWADLGINLDKAMGLLEKAVKAEPKNPAFLDSLGWVYFKLKRHEDALENISRAVELSTEPDDVLFDHLGDVSAALGRKQDAIKAWEQSLSVEDKEEVREKLDALKGKE